jgi:hypothetical protein
MLVLSTRQSYDLALLNHWRAPSKNELELSQSFSKQERMLP